MAEFRRILELARPDADLCGSRGILIGDIVERVFSEGDRLPLLNHPAANVDASDGAKRHHAAIPVSVAVNAAHRLAPDSYRRTGACADAARMAS